MIDYLCYMFTKYTNTWFFTATINSWQNLLFPDHRKEIIINALKYLVEQKKIKLHAYVIMPNHIHLIFTLLQRPADFGQFQLSLLRFTAKMIIKDIKEKGNENELLPYKSTQSDRAIHIWERRPKWIAVINHPIYLQKLKYIHLNPLQEKWRLVDAPELYPWSSAGFYAGMNDVKWITPL